MTAPQELVRLERQVWRALCTGGRMAADLLEDVLAEHVLMLLPGGLVIDDRRSAIDSMGGAPWDDFEITDERVVELGPGAAVVTYRASARRADQHYEALFNSTYLREHGHWRLALHQQTPT
jgi:hypothetical protein